MTFHIHIGVVFVLVPCGNALAMVLEKILPNLHTRLWTNFKMIYNFLAYVSLKCNELFMLKTMIVWGITFKAE